MVLAASYAARRYGIRSAMPMYHALRLCPEAVVLRPQFDKYRDASRRVRQIFRSATDRVEPLSLDEAFLDLRQTDVLPAAILAGIARRIEREVGITVSIGLSCNKFLAKIASDLDKPRGFAVIGQAEAVSFLAPRPVAILWGVGPATQRRLQADGFFTIGDLQRCSESDLVLRYGRLGRRLARFCRGEDERSVTPDAATVSISAETTFERDCAQAELLRQALQPLCTRVADRLRAHGTGGSTVTLKLKRTDFRVLTRSRTLVEPTMRADRIFSAASNLLAGAADGSEFRLIGVAVGDLSEAALADPPDLFEGATANGEAPGVTAISRAAAKARFRRNSAE